MKLQHALCVLLMAGCARTDVKPTPAVLIMAAASTKDALREAADTFTNDTGIHVTINADDSAKLATQIVHGAPADLFLSANDKWENFVKDNGFSKQSTPLLGNTLVLVVPRGNPARVSDPNDLLEPRVKRIAVAGPNVPAGIYARQALKSLKLWENVDKKLVPGENVRVTLTYVERGEAEAGIVYGTDARITDRVDPVHAFMPACHDPIVYPLALLTRTEPTRMLYDYLRTPAAQAIFQNHGFALPPMP